MPIEFKRGRAVFYEVVGVEEAELLLEALQRKPQTRVELADCTHLHTANLQVLMAAHPVIASWPANSELRGWLQATLGVAG